MARNCSSDKYLKSDKIFRHPQTTSFVDMVKQFPPNFNLFYYMLWD